MSWSATGERLVDRDRGEPVGEDGAIHRMTRWVSAWARNPARSGPCDRRRSCGDRLRPVKQVSVPVARRTGLIDGQQDRVAVAVQRQAAHPLAVSGLSPLTHCRPRLRL